MNTDAQSQFVVCTDRIQAGDIILTGGEGWQATAISIGDKGKFSHAAFLVNPFATFESDGGLIRHKLIRDLGLAEIGGRQFRIGEIPDNPQECAVYRHPGLAGVPPERLEQALADEFADSYGRDYSEWHRLVRIAKLPGVIRIVATEATKLYDAIYGADKIPGPFCSELVSRLFQRLELPLFRVAKQPDKITPNDLANSNELKLVEDAVVRLDQIKLVPGSALPEITPQLCFDAFAQSRRTHRGIEKLSTGVQAALSRVTAGNQKELQKILSSHQRMEAKAIELERSAAIWGRPGSLRRAARARQMAAQISPQLAFLAGQEVPNKALLFSVCMDIRIFSHSLSRSWVLLTSEMLKAAAKQANGWKRWRLHRERHKVLSAIRRDATDGLSDHSL